MSSNAETLRRLREVAAADGKCTECRLRFPRIGLKTCDVCLDRQYERRKANRSLLLCKCGRRPRRGCVTCPRCLAAKATRDSRRRNDSRATRTCTKCHRHPAAPRRAQCFGCLDDVAENSLRYYRRAGRKKTTRPCSICGSLEHNRRRHER